MCGGNVHVVNINTEDYSNEKNYFYVGRIQKKQNPLSNPFTFNGKRTSLKNLSFKTREEAVEAYRKYFKAAYGMPGYEALTKSFNEIYEKYKRGEDIYLACYCHPLPCHADVIKEELQKKLIREKLAEKKKLSINGRIRRTDSPQVHQYSADTSHIGT
jgi:hypothetical protein